MIKYYWESDIIRATTKWKEQYNEILTCGMHVSLGPLNIIYIYSYFVKNIWVWAKFELFFVLLVERNIFLQAGESDDSEFDSLTKQKKLLRKALDM